MRRLTRTVAGALLLCLVTMSLVTVSAGVGGAGTGSGKESGSGKKLVVPIGQILPSDSPVISFKANAEALQASVKGFNKRNKDIQFTLFYCDNKHDPNTEAECARQMVSRGVVATVGDIASSNSTAVNQILRDAGIPRIGLSMIGAEEFSSPVSYPLSSGPLIASAAECKVLADKGAKKISLVSQASPRAAGTVALLKAPCAAAGVEIGELVQVPIGTTDYTSYVSTAAKDADGILCVCTPTEGLPTATAAAQLGLKVPVSLILLGFSLDQIVNTGYETWAFADSFPAPEQVNVKEFPKLKQFLADMKAAKNPDLVPGKLTGAMIQGWLGLQAITELVKGESSVTAASLKSALDTAQNIDMLGIIPPWTPSKPGPTPLFSRVSNPVLYRAEFKNGKIVSSKKNPIDTTPLFASSR